MDGSSHPYQATRTTASFQSSHRGSLSFQTFVKSRIFSPKKRSTYTPANPKHIYKWVDFRLPGKTYWMDPSGGWTRQIESQPFCSCWNLLLKWTSRLPKTTSSPLKNGMLENVPLPLGARPIFRFFSLFCSFQAYSNISTRENPENQFHRIKHPMISHES